MLSSIKNGYCKKQGDNGILGKFERTANPKDLVEVGMLEVLFVEIVFLSCNVTILEITIKYKFRKFEVLDCQASSCVLLLVIDT